MKKSLTLFAYISFALILVNQILVIAFVKQIYSKINNSAEMDKLIYIIIIISVTFLIIIGLLNFGFILRNTVKSAFIGAILGIVFGVMLLFTIFLFTWIYGTINIICGVILIVVGIVHLKSSRDYL